MLPDFLKKEKARFIEQLEKKRFPMMVYPKNQDWDGKDIRSIKYKIIESLAELENVKDDCYLDWQDLKKPKKTKQVKQAKLIKEKKKEEEI